VRDLDRTKFPITQVSVIAQNLESEQQIKGYVTAGDVAGQGAGAGAWIGGLFGLLAGGAFLLVPGVGPVVVAGSLAAVLLGGAEGAAVGAVGGGLFGALAGWGISRQHILKYTEHLQGGKYLVIANGTTEEIARAEQILRKGDLSPAEQVAIAAL
jgi:hypothetical protein